MSESNGRFGRRPAQDGAPPHAEPVLSFTTTPRNDKARRRDLVEDQAAPRLDRGTRKAGPMIDEADRPLQLSGDTSRRGTGAFGWLALLAVLAVAGAGYAWHVYTNAPPATAPVAQGYSTPGQPANQAQETPNPPPAQALGAAGQVPESPKAVPSEPDAKSVAAAPAAKSLPATPAEPPRKTISDAAAEHPLTTTTPPSAEKSATPEKPATTTRHEEAKPVAPRKESALAQPKPRPAVATPEPPMPDLPPRAAVATPEPPMPDLPAPAQTATAPAAVPAPSRPAAPQTFSGRAATGAPQPLAPAAAPATQNATAAPSPQPQAPSYNLTPFLNSPTPAAAPAATAPPAAPPLQGTTTTVKVDGINYVDGEQPHALGTVNQSTPAASGVPQLEAQPGTTSSRGTRPYVPPADSEAPLPNDVIIGPGGQLSVPTGSPQ